MKSQPLTDRHTIADVWSDLYETWTRTLVSPWKLGDPSERKAAELSGPAPSAAGFLAWQEAWDYWVDGPTIPNMLSDAKARKDALAVIRAVVSAAGEVTGERARWLARIETILGAPAPTAGRDA
jgi:hypothetical protein